MEFEEEFKIRSQRLGKRRNHKREYRILKQILENPYPLRFCENMKQLPDSARWMSLNLEKILNENKLAPIELFKLMQTIDKTISLAWGIRDSKGNNIVSLVTDEYATFANRTPLYLEEMGIPLQRKSDQIELHTAKKVLDYLRTIPDYKNYHEVKNDN